ncbi:MAG: fasciclin domain-containing protein [Ignavibacteriaceae bacterium]
MLHKIFSQKLIISAFMFSLIFTSLSFAGDHHKSKSSKKDIVTTAVEAGNFNTLATALTEAGLIEALQGDGPFTVFAPSDDAFAKLPEGTIESLLKDKEALTKVLLYHVVSGEVTSKEVVKLKKAETLEGEYITIKTTDDGVMINNSNIIGADIMASNGVIHVIDTVLLPE